eukprot:TRINITY_DN79013_c0_g1_i1.p1 TRINITY_DN79013_c0_g1~~TRINITY_DN79013_c0_g1_i1.p1  ORF type:complete len:367 (-),score=62.10 TRINITY_DN79013_c0_g1_i1:199-1266(-)
MVPMEMHLPGETCTAPGMMYATPVAGAYVPNTSQTQVSPTYHDDEVKEPLEELLRCLAPTTTLRIKKPYEKQANHFEQEKDKLSDPHAKDPAIAGIYKTVRLQTSAQDRNVGRLKSQKGSGKGNGKGIGKGSGKGRWDEQGRRIWEVNEHPPAVVPTLPATVAKVTHSGPPIGNSHQFHRETGSMGTVGSDWRSFTKKEFDGRLSVVTECELRTSGKMRYAVEFTSGELSNADGVGFIFSNKLPCPKNIQKIVSIFANRTGRICVRAFSEVIRSNISVKPIELGDTLEVVIDLDEQKADFIVWPVDGSTPSSASLSFGGALDSLRQQMPRQMPTQTCGYLAAVVKNIGVCISIKS